MSDEQQENVLGLFILLMIAGITLKLIGYNDWSWWLLLFPIWGFLLIGTVSAFVMIIISWWTE